MLRTGLARAGTSAGLLSRRVDFLAGLEFDFADGEDLFRLLVEQPDDLRVQHVEHLAMLG